MKIALIGYGKMGKEIEKEALKKNHEIILKSTKETSLLENLSLIKQADIAIEFTNPNHAFDNICFCLKNNIPILSGTTGWIEKHRKEITNICQRENGLFFYSPNFSIGVHIFFEINRRLTKLIENYLLQYEIEIEETHHIEKKDKPSGTALLLSNIIKEAFMQEDSKKNITIESKRTEKEIGTHKVRYYSNKETIEVTHQAYNRSIYAEGTLKAAQWLLKQQRGKLFFMEDLLKFNC